MPPECLHMARGPFKVCGRRDDGYVRGFIQRLCQIFRPAAKSGIKVRQYPSSIRQACQKEPWPNQGHIRTPRYCRHTFHRDAWRCLETFAASCPARPPGTFAHVSSRQYQDCRILDLGRGKLKSTRLGTWERRRAVGYHDESWKSRGGCMKPRESRVGRTR